MLRLCAPGPVLLCFETPKMASNFLNQSGARGVVTPIGRPGRRAFHGGPEAVGWPRSKEGGGGMLHVRPKPGRRGFLSGDLPARLL